MPTTYGNIRDSVAIRPMPSPSHVGLKVTARCSTPVYTCENPSRHEVAKRNYERRDHQIHYCGYRSVNYKPYKEVGEVILDDQELILRALGQYTENEQSKEEEYPPPTWMKQISQNFTDTKDVIALVQPKIENLQTLNEQLTRGRLLLNKVKLGIDLFRLIREERKKKAFASEKERIQHEAESRTSMRAAEDSHSSYDDENDANDISKYIMSPFVSKRNGANAHGDLYLDVFQPPTDTGGNWSTPQVKINDCPDAPERGLDASADQVKLDYNCNGISNARTSANDASREEDSIGFYPMMYNGKTAKAKVSKNKKYKTSLPRPFSPVFTNVNFYETQSTKHTFKQLCALHWILEAMSLDQPASMPPISTCWNLKDLKQDLTTAHKRADRDKAVEPIWKAFLSNPKRFTRAKTGKRGTLLQRRVSIAPNALRRMSSASINSFTSGSKISSNGDDLRSSSGTPSSANNKVSSQARKISRTVPPAGDDLPGPRKRSQSKKISVSQMDDAPLQQSPISSPKAKEKGFVIREVVIARSAFGRKESRTSKGRVSISKGPTIGGGKKGRKSVGSDSTPAVHQEQRERLSSESKGDATIKPQQSLTGGSSVFEPSSHSVEDEKLSSNFKEKFEELATENALDLHDKLEQREKTSVESMQRKFHALHIMSDVHRAVVIMRSKSRLKVETDEEKKARFSEECSWYKSLLENLPVEVREDNYNALVLDKIAKYGSLEGRKISSTQFIKVLSILRPWELCYPDISAAIEFVRDKVVEMDKDDFEAWFQSRIGEKNHLETSFNKSDA